MTAPEMWHWAYHGVARGDCLHGRCAACEYDGPTVDFRVWLRGGQYKVLCRQCSYDVRETMEYQQWVLERDDSPPS